MHIDIMDVYQMYANLCGGDGPQRTIDEIQTAVHAAGLRYEEVNDDFWESLNHEWFWGHPESQPFVHNNAANAQYRELAAIRGIWWT